MTWSNFFVTISVIYIIYYAINIVIDLVGVGKKVNKEELETLSFSDDYIPIKVPFDDLEKGKTEIQFDDIKKIDVIVEKQKSDEAKFKETKEVNKKTATGITGGVTINELVDLAKNEAILKSKSIVFA